jgi:hypothetical protein
MMALVSVRTDGFGAGVGGAAAAGLDSGVEDTFLISLQLDAGFVIVPVPT